MRRFRKPGWLFLLLGIGIGVTGVMLWQMYAHRGDGRSGLTNLFTSLSRPAEKPVKKEAEPAKPPKPKFDFYTILPETETVLPERRSKTKPAKAKLEEGVSYILQAGSFAGFEEADNMKARLALTGLVAHIQKVIIEGKGEYHRVRLGPFENIDKLDTTAVQLQKMGIKALRLKVKKGEMG
ncbi:MAG: SPOR domain-containing protein [Gallionella sp.]|nr:SPOR domain-containing protein [Gallionella sp.]